jgi:predicted ATP-grasp superfamily ATP-dependent carboligase
MKDTTNSKDVCELFVEGSHHRNISVACILQKGVSKGKETRTMSINTQYIVLFKNPRDQIGPAILARQSSDTSLLFVEASLIRSSMTIKLGYLVSINESSFRFSGKPCRNSMFLIMLGKETRTMSINTQYIVLFKNPRDQIGPAILARQMYPSHPKKFMIKYTEATNRPYGYLFIDLKQNTPEEDRLKTDIVDSVSDNKRC